MPAPKSGIKRNKTTDKTKEKESLEIKSSVSLKKKLTVTDEYFRIQSQYYLSHGPRIIFLMQIGAFYEIYGYVTGKAENGDEIFNEESWLAEFLDITGYKIMDKAQKWNGYTVLGTGFQEPFFDSMMELLLGNGFTVVVFVQKPTKSNGMQDRELYGIFSPGTYFSGIENDADMGMGGRLANKITNHVMCIWSEAYKKRGGGRGKEETWLMIGVVVMNIFSGQSFVYEYEKQVVVKCMNTADLTGSEKVGGRGRQGFVEIYEYNPTLFDELERFEYTYSPNETIIIAQNAAMSDAVLDYAGIRNNCPMNHVVLMDRDAGKREKLANCKNPKYADSILSSVFGEKAVNQCNELNRTVNAKAAYCYLLNFMNEHKPELIRKIPLPTFYNTSDRVVLANHTLQQLNILEVEDAKGLRSGGGGGGNMRSLVGFLNRALTPMGKRKTQECIVSPTSSAAILENEYAMISDILGTKEAVDNIREQLRGVRDIERICRQLLTKRICPGVLFNLHDSLKKLVTLEAQTRDYPWWNRLISLSGLLTSCGDNLPLDGKVVKYIEFRVELDACRGVTSITGAGKPVVWNSEVEEISRELLMTETLFAEAAAACNKLLGQDWAHVRKTEKGQWSIEMTKLRGKLLLERIMEMANGTEKNSREEKSVEWFQSLRITKQGNNETNVCITSDELVKASARRITLLETLAEITSKFYGEFIADLSEKWHDTIAGYGKLAAWLDMIVCKAFVSREYHYCRPVIYTKKEDENSEDGDDNTSLPTSDEECNDDSVQDSGGGFIYAKGLRHPLIEHINENEIYVPNDICVGRFEDGVVESLISGFGENASVDEQRREQRQEQGWLLYGTNAVGKTSLIRSVGIAIIMAQAGFFVPCSSFVFRPYRAIYTRILGNDNLFKGMSTFDVEMSELRGILRDADKWSLVLGDELCSGTEIESALSIFVASLEHLMRVGCTFLFATHFHEIVYYSEVEEMMDLDRYKRGILGLKHLTVHYDAEQGKLIYDRRLKEGPGSALYGLEVCKSLHMPVDFIDRTYELRTKYGHFHRRDCGGLMTRLDDDVSTYNSRKIRGRCERCRCVIGEEIHHIYQQKMADERGFITTEDGRVFHKNHKANLMSLCKKCHLLEHHS